MKLKATRKEIKQNANKIISIGYCGLQVLLKYQYPFAYSTRAEGWACDYYDIDGVIISTGYAPIGDRVDYDIVKEYEKRAEGIVYNSNFGDYETKKEQVNNLLSKFIKQVTKK